MILNQAPAVDQSLLVMTVPWRSDIVVADPDQELDKRMMYATVGINQVQPKNYQ